MDDQRNDTNDSLPEFRHYSAWQLIKAYWQSTQRISATLFFIVIIAMTIGLVAFDVVFNYWYNYFYDALQAYNKHGVVRLLVVFIVLAAFYMLLAVYRYYVSQLFGLRWRRWLTEKFLERWLRNRSYYYLENFDSNTDNPDQRIQEDIGALVLSSISLCTGFIGAIATFVAFIYILWTLSGQMVIPLGPFGKLEIPGYLVWVGILYAAIGTLLTIRIGRPLVFLNFEQQRREATFRFAAIDLRSHAEHVALYQGEAQQEGILKRLFNRVLENYYLLILRQKTLLWFTAGYNQASVLLPLVVALPNYFDKVFLLGGLIQSLKAFTQVQDSLSFIITSYPQIAEWQAVTKRLTTFINHLEDADNEVSSHKDLVISHQATNDIKIEHLNLFTPRRELLLKDINLEFKHGENYLLQGRSGIGKSSFIKVIAGIWPYAQGKIQLPDEKKIMYLSQRPYMPIGTLAEAILFPDRMYDVANINLEELLTNCKLKNLIPRLNEQATWSEQLSPGEQQRIACARVLLQKPDWVFMDESTSMMDVLTESYLYQFIKTTLPNCSIISVGHRPSLEKEHDIVINMEQFSVRVT